MFFETPEIERKSVRLQDLPSVTRYDVDSALKRNDPAELELVSITVALSDLDYQFAQSVCVRLCGHASGRVRGNALVSLGHLARRFRKLDESAVRPLLENALCDTNEYVRVRAKSAADEIHQFLHWSIAGHIYG